MTSGSGLVVTESGGACILSDSAVPWCVVNISTCASPRTVRRNRGEPWDYCERPAYKIATCRVHRRGQLRALRALCLAARLSLSSQYSECWGSGAHPTWLLGHPALSCPGERVGDNIHLPV